ncbi:hypothetical protein QBC33DRAFT_574334 [Phialemonium atrogriseum]|uniref:Uncharacterized protein n=1 Tax=Phialemonium atrogriseum TaxID=1093897 RepID=A0AAJ0BQ06_9PEZI|nr:uncharacterized protein QBC33DRAFT_574334 [Phialemonium atrogriseum]KAK1762335.1 hypothetical protein QBC33DRAFT_574334 [Phialemonium atrogriseum]
MAKVEAVSPETLISPSSCIRDPSRNVDGHKHANGEVCEYTKNKKGTISVAPGGAKYVLFNDLPSDEAETWTATLTHRSAGVFLSKQTYAAWRDIPSTYVVGERDKSFFSMEIVDIILDTARALEPTSFDVVRGAVADTVS